MTEWEITKERLDKYFNITSRAFEIVKKNIADERDNDAKEILQMVGNYLSDAKHFELMGEWVNSFAALNYAHGWIDAGVRLGVFNVNDRDLFTIR